MAPLEPPHNTALASFYPGTAPAQNTLIYAGLTIGLLRPLLNPGVNQQPPFHRETKVKRRVSPEAITMREIAPSLGGGSPDSLRVLEHQSISESQQKWQRTIGQSMSDAVGQYCRRLGRGLQPGGGCGRS